jgi:hypothetical protein
MLQANRWRGAGWIAAACLFGGVLQIVVWFGDWRVLAPIERNQPVLTVASESAPRKQVVYVDYIRRCRS